MFNTPAHLVGSNVSITVIGCGGTGSYLLSYLAQINYLLRMLSDDSVNLNVTVYDPDTVSPYNVGRQNFYPMDISLNKAKTLVDRINMGFGTQWKAIGEAAEPDKRFHSDIIVTCLDKASFRHAFGKANAGKFNQSLWIDVGNGSHSGQCILGHLGDVPSNRLPNLYDLYGDTLLDAGDNDEPSCSHADSIAKQTWGVNHFSAFLAASAIWGLLKHGGVSHHGGYFDLMDGELTPLMPLPEVWQSYGYQAGQKPAQ